MEQSCFTLNVLGYNCEDIICRLFETYEKPGFLYKISLNCAVRGYETTR